jgi:hypothetical protein
MLHDRPAVNIKRRNKYVFDMILYGIGGVL